MIATTSLLGSLRRPIDAKTINTNLNPPFASPPSATCVSRRRCSSSDSGPGSATWSLIHTQQPVELTFVDGFRLSLPRFLT